MCAGTVVAPARPHLGGDRFRDFEIEIGRLEGQLRIVPLMSTLARIGNGVAPLDHAMDMAERSSAALPRSTVTFICDPPLVLE